MAHLDNYFLWVLLSTVVVGRILQWFLKIFFPNLRTMDKTLSHDLVMSYCRVDFENGRISGWAWPSHTSPLKVLSVLQLAQKRNSEVQSLRRTPRTVAPLKMLGPRVRECEWPLWAE